MRLAASHCFMCRIIRRDCQPSARRHVVSRLLILTLLLPYAVPTPALTLDVNAISKASAPDSTSTASPAGTLPGGTRPTQQEGNRGMPPPDQPMQSLLEPGAPRSASSLAASVAQLHLTPQGSITLQRRQPIAFGALPLDENGNAVQGLTASWASSNSHIVSITPGGQAVGGNSGTATLTATAGGVSANVQVTVVASAWSYGGTKPDSSRAGLSQSSTSLLAQNSRGTETRGKKAFEMAHGVNPTGVPMPSRPPTEDPLPDSETNSLYAPANIVGAPPGRTEPGAGSPQAATGGSETPGSSNFSFGIPIISLPGRGLNASLALVYNSRVWNKSKSLDRDENEITHLTFDVDSDWPAPGFRLGYGQLEAQGSFGFTLIAPDGTRHRLLKPSTSASYYESTDGTFIRFYGGQSGGTVLMTDGTRVRYGATGTGGFRSFPTQLTDRHGNVVQVFYVNNVGPKIDYIEDTLARRIQFVYNNGDLISIKAPGYDNSPTPREVIRFYYQDSYVYSYFGPSICPTCASPSGSVRVISNVFMPALDPTGLPSGVTSGSGYHYDYSGYGMIYQIRQYRRMQLDEATGQLLNESQWQQAASTFYNYPTSPAPIGDAPKFTFRQDHWSGMTTADPVYTFAVDEQPYGLSTSSITAPDGTVTETKTTSSNGGWDDGLVKETVFKKGTKIWAKTALNWEQTPGTLLPRLLDAKVTNEAGQTRATVYSNFDAYNHARTVSERDFADAGTYGTELRRTETTYLIETNSNYLDRRLLHLPKTVQVVANGKVASRTEYAYDGSALVDVLPNYTRISTQDQTYDPYTPDQVEVCTQHDNDGECTQWQLVSVYDEGTGFRGDVTSVKTYADAANLAGATENTMKYDITGNMVEETVNCCRRKTFTYAAGFFYAYPTAMSRGDASQFTSYANYDFNTGLTRSSTDENGYQTTLYYEARTLRQLSVQTSNGGKTDFYYYDGLFPDPDATHGHSYVHTATKLDDNVSGGRWMLNYTFYDGHGAVARNFSNWRAYQPQPSQAKAWETTDIEYDIMGRVKGTNNPYYSAGAEGGQINQQGWTYRQYDDLGRVTSTTLPDGTSIGIDYNGTVTTVTDQANHQRRQLTDALGRVVRLDEPDASGSLGVDFEHPNQPTEYKYDALNNLIYVKQAIPNGSKQERFFKYDSLGRMLYDRQVEQSATPYSTTEAVEGNSAWSDKMVYDTRGLLTDAYDARKIHTHFDYADGLNRLTKIAYTKADDSPEGTPKVFYTYDQQRSGYSNAGRLTEIRTEATARAPQTVQAYDYNQTGQVARQRQIVGDHEPYQLIYTYNLIGALTSEQYPSNRVISYAYDEGAHLSGISGTTPGQSPRAYLSNLSYAAHGGLLSATMGNGAVETMSYNSRLQPTSISLTRNNSVLQRYDYQYGVVNPATGAVDASKNTGQVASIEGSIGADRQWQQRFSYDSLGRLSQAAEFTGDSLSLTYRSTYDYDRFGNRYQKQTQNPVNEALPYTPVEDQHIDKLTNRFAASFGVAYDAGGNVIEDSKFRGLKYEYDANGRQWWSAPLSNQSNAAVAVYDGVGQRVQMSADGVTTLMVYDIYGQLVAEYGGQASGGAGGVQYVLSDLQGSTRAMLNNDGAVTARHDYQAFGVEIGAGTGKRTSGQRYSATDSTRQRYAGMEQEGELSHTWFRQYEHQSGRWTTPDPYGGSMSVAEPQSFNRYSYVQNDPVNFVDPSGLQEKQCVDSHGNPIKCPDDDEHYWDKNNFTIDRTQTSLFVFSWSKIDTFLRDWQFVLNSRFGGFRGSGNREGFGPGATTQPTPLSDVQIQKRIAEGQAWERWLEWERCARQIMEKYKQKYNVKMQGSRRMEIVVGGSGTVALLMNTVISRGLTRINPAVAVAATAAEVGQIVKEYNDVTELNSDFLFEAQQKCGPRVPKP